MPSSCRRRVPRARRTFFPHDEQYRRQRPLPRGPPVDEEDIRWLILDKLYNVRLQGPHDFTMRQAILDSQGIFGLDPKAVDRNTKYLQEKNLVEVRWFIGGDFMARLTAYGVDEVERGQKRPAPAHAAPSAPPINSSTPSQLPSRSSADGLRALKARIRPLRAEYDQAAARFKAGQALGDVLLGVGSRWAEETFDVPSGEARRAAQRLRAQWKESKPYTDLAAKYSALEVDVEKALSISAARQPTLKKVRDAALLPTKLTRLDAVLSGAIEQVERPASTSASRERRAGSRAAQAQRAMSWKRVGEVLGAIGSIASIVSLLVFLATQPYATVVLVSLVILAIACAGVVVVLYLLGRRARRGAG